MTIHNTIRQYLLLFDYNYPLERTPFEFYLSAKERVFSIKQVIVQNLYHLSDGQKQLLLAYAEGEVRDALGKSSYVREDLDKWLEKFEIEYESLLNCAKSQLHCESRNDLLDYLHSKSSKFMQTFQEKDWVEKQNAQNDFYGYWFTIFLEELLDYIATLSVGILPSRKELFLSSFINNFDELPGTEVYEFFEPKLVGNGHLSLELFEKWLKSAFEYKNSPIKSKRYILKNPKPLNRVRSYFYNYFITLAKNPYGKKPKYVRLLVDFFQGYEFESTSSNFSK